MDKPPTIAEEFTKSVQNEQAKYDQSLQGKREGDVAVFGGQQAVAAYHEHLYQISDDERGSPVDDYFNPEDAAVIRAFIQMAHKKKFPNAMRVDLRKGLVGTDAWRPGGHPGKNWFSKMVFYRPVRSVLAYPIGTLNVADGEMVVVDEDANLRLERTEHNLIKSKALGFGRLPDAAVMRRIVRKEDPLIRVGAPSVSDKLAPYLVEKQADMFEHWPY